MQLRPWMIIVWEIEEMKKMKRNIALMLTLCMVLTNIVPAYADEVTAHEEPVIQQEVSGIEISEIIPDFETNEAASDGGSYKDETILENIEEATPANELYYKIDKDNNVLYISSEYKDEGYEPFDSSQIPPWQPLEVKSGINSVIIENEIHPSSMCKWFSGCTGLRSVTGLSCVVVPENIAEMFSDCTSLETFDLSNFNTSNVTNMSGMFKGCSGLKTIYVQNFNTEKVLSSDDMFTDCINLCGGNGTVYNLVETEKKYARIDKHDQSGYFTYGGSDQTTAYFVSKGQIVCTRTVRGGDGITVPGFAREGCDGWYIGKEIKYLPGDEFKTSAGESSYTLYDEWIQEKIDWQIIFDDQERYRKYSESSGTVSFTPAYVTSGYADITYRIDNSTDYFYITDPCKAEIMISRDTPAGTYALHISATAAEDDLHKKTSKTINYKLIVYENAQTEITLDHGMHGTGGYTSAVAKIGKAMPVIKPPTAATGYVFDGYYDAESGGTKYYNAEGTSARVWDKDTKSYTLLAQWMPESYTITYDLAGGTVSGSNPGTYTIESDSITLINPTKDGYIFTGWTGTGLDSPAMNVTIPAGSTGDRSYTATWERRYEIEIHSNNTEYGTVSAAAVSNLPYGTVITASENVLTVGSTDVTATASENTAKYSYSFKEWSGIPAGGTVTADIAITAVFERIAQKYTVTFEGNFVGSEYSESITETYGSKYIIPTEEPKRTGYTFLGWYANSTGGTKITSDSVVDITSDTSLYAQWKKNSSRGGGTSDSSSKPAFTGTWGNPVTGIWTRDTDGVWHFRTNAPFVSTWGYIVNPYAQAGQNQADWFWFDDNGRMLTGWQYINGHWYYLNPSKDGTLGSCLIGPGRTPDGYEIDASGAWTGR